MLSITDGKEFPISAPAYMLIPSMSAISGGRAMSIGSSIASVPLEVSPGIPPTNMPSSTPSGTTHTLARKR